ncbi:hypothetical protein BVRB_5g112190 [Beta vulgaris subsp. vulgaris]|nr:hypothetical protein BVRB_5g112190 [Beta vulgaris subsp. vulgaris]
MRRFLHSLNSQTKLKSQISHSALVASSPFVADFLSRRLSVGRSSLLLSRRSSPPQSRGLFASSQWSPPLGRRRWSSRRRSLRENQKNGDLNFE